MSGCSSFPAATPILPASASPAATWKIDSSNINGPHSSLYSSDETRDRVRKLFVSTEVSASAYDTAWVAMVPSHGSGSIVMPCFPERVNWILENQQKNGSWGLGYSDHDQPSNLLVKDTMSSTLACVLALKRWGIGNQQIHNGLGFMEQSAGFLTDPAQQTPIGFDVIFPAMIQTCVKDFNLNLPLKSADIDALVRNRESVLNNSGIPSSRGRNAYLAYISEGIGDLQDWETAMKFQRNNGSLFNSPSATAAALIHLRDDANSLRYLRSVVDVTSGKNFCVPAIYPNGTHARLCLIDAIDNLGISRYFREEIKVALDDIYRIWEEGDEEIFFHSTACAMAFRILRLNGYPVSPAKFLAFHLHGQTHCFVHFVYRTLVFSSFAEVFGRFSEDRYWNETMGGYLKDERAVLELHKASEVMYPEESILEHQHCWTTRSLTKSDQDSWHSKPISTQVHDALNYPSKRNLERLKHRRNIEHEQLRVDNNTRTLKSSFRFPSFGNQDMLKLAVEDFNFCQSLHQEELAHVMRWMKEYKLDEMRLAKGKMGYCFFSVAATSFGPELSHARISWAKHSLLTALFDEIYDMYGTPEEQLNLVHLLEKWDAAGPKVDFCSERVESLYWALHNAICETTENALALHGRSVMDHIVETWLDLLRSELREAEWSRTNTQPTLEEYLSSGMVSIGLEPIVLSALYVLGPKLSDEVAKGPEIRNLSNILGTCGRLLNDRRSTDRDAEHGNWNAVSLWMSEGNLTEEESDEEIKGLAEDLRKELLRLVFDEQGSTSRRVPKECRELFRRMSDVLHYSYYKENGFGNVLLGRDLESLIEKPIKFVH